ncbi:hypothetical protein ACHAWX_006009 [Stephanocyclus meneghinianus]
MVTYLYDANAVLFRPIKSLDDESYINVFKTYKRIEKTHIQLVEGNDHRVNAVERIIDVIKDHIIACLCMVDPIFPMPLWDELIEQGEISLNLMRKQGATTNSRPIAEMGEFNFSETPICPPDTKWLFLNPQPTSGLPEHMDEMDETKAFINRKTATFVLFHLKMPAVEIGDTVRLAAINLIHALQNK